MDEFLMKPKIDFAFKEIMEDEKARTGFLSAVLGLDPKDIKETRILNTNLRREHEDDKQGILDVRLMMNNDSEIDIEIQLSELNVWADRSLFYLAKMFTSQIKPGDSYRMLKKCVSISILNFKLFHNEKEFYSRFHIKEDTRGFLFTDKMEFHVIELPKLPGRLTAESTDLELWANFINAERKEEFDMLAQKNSYIESAYKQLQVISQDSDKRMEYEAREKAIRDYNEGLLEAQERGIEIGQQRGIEIGQQRGIEIGQQRGIEIGQQRGIEIGQQRGIEIGQQRAAKRINELFCRLLRDKRYDDLARAAEDAAYQQQLLNDYGI